MAPKSFAAAAADHAGTPIDFEVAGEVFTIPRPVPALPLLELAAVADEQNPSKMVAAFTSYLLAVLPAAEHDRFRAAATTARLPLEVIIELVQWVIGESTGRPTEPPSSSDGRPSPNGTSPSGGSPTDPPETP